MEYPNVTVIGESGSDFQLNVVIAHEVEMVVLRNTWK